MRYVMLNINQQHHETSITITPFNILDALKTIKSQCSKSSGVDGVVFAHSRIHVLLSLLFSTFFITHRLLLVKYVYYNRHCPDY